MTVTLRPTTAWISGMAATIGEPGVVEGEMSSQDASVRRY